jgi:hypothetical protein
MEKGTRSVLMAANEDLVVAEEIGARSVQPV